MGTEKNQNEIENSISTDETNNLNQQQNKIELTNLRETNSKTNIKPKTSKLLNTYSTSTDEVQHLNLIIDENNVFDGAKQVIQAIRPDWNLDDVQYKLFTNGITNKLVGCFYTAANNSKPDSIDEDPDDSGISNEQEEVVLVRVYGNKTDLLIDRSAETINIKLLHGYGLAPALYAVFKNGLAYEFVPGCTLTPETVVSPHIWKLIASKMAEMHKVERLDDNGFSSGKKRKPMLWTKTQKFLDLIPEKYSDITKHKRLASFLPVSKLRSEFETLYTKLEKLNSPIVFSHNDLLLGNVIYTESTERVTFIDYEYADYNFQAFDIGNHFSEFVGINEIDYNRYPSKEFQIEWLRVYLESFLEHEIVADEKVEQLYVQVNQFALAAHFFWAVWALIQAEYSNIDFDFTEYAHLRYSEYLAKKNKFLELKV